MINQEAFNVGATAVPGPVDEMFWDGWLWHWVGSFFSNSAFVLPANDGPGSYRIPIDSRAMRKWKESDVLVGVAQAVNEIPSTVLRVELNTRILEKLP